MPRFHDQAPHASIIIGPCKLSFLFFLAGLGTREDFSWRALGSTMNLLESVCITIITFVMVYLIAKKLRTKASKSPVKPGKVVVHQFPRSHVFWPGVLSGSPPCLKLETFLRIFKIPYENDFRMIYSKQSKMPWIEFNGQEIADSNFCIQFLSKEFQVDVDSHLSATERAIAHSILTMLEENTYW